MILLNFSTAAKYVLSLMMAILGIIPFEQVELPEQKSVLTSMEYLSPEDPLQAISSLAFFDESPSPAFISPRNIFPTQTELFEDFEILECSLTTEIEDYHIYIYFSDDEDKVKKEKIVFLSQGS